MIHLRTCLLHPKERAVSWSGHVHLLLEDSVRILVGRCKRCDVREDLITSYEGKCTGCYGSIDGLR